MKPFLNKFLNIFTFRRHAAFLATLGAVFVFGFLILPVHSAYASPTVAELVGGALSFIFSIIFAVLGWILSSLLGALVSIAEYNKIVNQDTVIKTWGVVRDIVNMFFIFAMLLIAFSTILRYQQYEVKKLLPKLVLYAVLVNFSLTICGLFIDLAQVFTLTFVNAFADGAINNFATVTQLFNYSNLSTSDVQISTFTVIGGYMLAFVLLLVTLVTIGAMFLILLVRIAYLWILSILSPFAFVLPIIPGGQSYATQWWTMFSKQVITGPLLAFFIWLSLSILTQTGNIGNEILNKSLSEATGAMKTATVTGLPELVPGVPTSQADFLINYVIAIAMMFIGLMLTSQMGGAAGKIAGAASSKMQSYGTTAAKWTGRRVGVWGAVGAMTGGLGLMGGAIGGAAAGMGARTAGGWMLRNIPGLRNSLPGRWAQDRYDQRQRKSQQNRQRTMEKMGMGDRTFERISDWGQRLNLPAAPGTSMLRRAGKAAWSVPLSILTGGAISRTTFGAANRATQTRRNARADANIAATTGAGVRNGTTAFVHGTQISPAGGWYTNNGLPERRFHSLGFTNNDSAYLYRHGLNQANGVPDDVRQAMLNAMTQYVTEQTTRGGGGTVNQHIQDILNDNASGAIDSGPLAPEPNLRNAFMTGIDANKMQRTITERERLGLNNVSSEDLVKTSEAAKIDRDFAVRQKTPAREAVLERMRQGESPDDIINSVKNYEEKVAKGEYYNGERVNDVQRQQEAYEKWEKGGDVNKMTGIGGSEREVSKGRGATLAVNFEDETLKELDLQGAGGAYISGDNKKQAADALAEYLYKQLNIENSKKESGQQQSDEEITKEVEQFQQMLQQAKGVSLINKAQTGIGADERSLHEKFHRNLNDVDQEQMMGAWNAIPEEERRNTEERIRGTVKGGKDMPMEEVVEEYLVEGLTNATGRGRGDTKLDQKTLDQFEQMGVVRKMEQKTATGEMRTIYRPTKEAPEEKTELEREWKDEAQAKPHTLTEKAAQEEGVEIEEKSEGKIEKKDAAPPEEEKKEEKTAQAAPAYSAAEIKTIPQVQSVVKQVMEESAKGMMDPLFFRKMSTIFNKAIGTLSGAQAGQANRLLKSMGGLKEASEHTQSDNPLIRESAKQEYNIKLEEFKNEYYNAVGEDPASEDEIKDAIGDLK